MSIMKIQGRVTSSQNPIPGGLYRPTYGTGGYLTLAITETSDGQIVSACRTSDGTCQWWERLTDDAIVVEVVVGDVERIKRIVKAEVDHFDSCVTWTE